MNKSLFEKLSSLPPLENKKCKICGGISNFFDVVDFNKFCSSTPLQYGLSHIDVTYYRCPACEFIFTDFIDDWTIAETSRFIYNEDYIKVDSEYTSARPLRTAGFMAVSLSGCEDLRILDYGSGSGVFSEAMKGRGYRRIENYDPFSSPEKPLGLFDIILLFEVIEHIPNPKEVFLSLRDMLSKNGAIIIGQSLQPDNIAEIKGNWWYISPRNGHVSTYSKRTFLEMAELGGLTYYHSKNANYAFAHASVSNELAKALQKLGTISKLIRLYSDNSNSNDPWHKRESNKKGSFRWTASAEIDWTVSFPPKSETIMEISYAMEIEPNFAIRSQVTVDGCVMPTTVKATSRGGTIQTIVKSEDGAAKQVKLVTPVPVSPASLGRNTDARLLGLAIDCAPEITASKD